MDRREFLAAVAPVPVIGLCSTEAEAKENPNNLPVAKFKDGLLANGLELRKLAKLQPKLDYQPQLISKLKTWVPKEDSVLFDHFSTCLWGELSLFFFKDDHSNSFNIYYWNFEPSEHSIEKLPGNNQYGGIDETTGKVWT